MQSQLARAEQVAETHGFARIQSQRTRQGTNGLRHDFKIGPHGQMAVFGKDVVVRDVGFGGDVVHVVGEDAIDEHHVTAVRQERGGRGDWGLHES